MITAFRHVSAMAFALVAVVGAGIGFLAVSTVIDLIKTVAGGQ